ncbi:hypothetical protein GEMRC1_011472 [Eukaryota sp. GEM-RC1]
MTSQRFNVRHKIKQFIVDVIGYSLLNHITQSGSKSLNIHPERPNSWSMLPAQLFKGYSDGVDHPVLIKINFPSMNPWLFFEVCHKFKDSAIFSHTTASPFQNLNYSGSLHIISDEISKVKQGVRSHVSVWKPGYVIIEGDQSIINPSNLEHIKNKMKPRMVQYQPSPDNSSATRVTISFDDEATLTSSPRVSVEQWAENLSSHSHPCRILAYEPVVMAMKLDRGYEESGVAKLVKKNTMTEFRSWNADVHAFYVLPDLNELLQIESACVLSQRIAEQHSCCCWQDISDFSSYQFSKEAPKFHFFKILPCDASTSVLSGF